MTSIGTEVSEKSMSKYIILMTVKYPSCWSFHLLDDQECFCLFRLLLILHVDAFTSVACFRCNLSDHGAVYNYIIDQHMTF